MHSLYQWEYLLRYGLTDNLEFRIFSNGFTAQASKGKQAATTGYSPLAFSLRNLEIDLKGPAD